MPPRKKKKKATVKQYQPCCPPAPRRRRVPVYMPRQQPQFYAPLPMPQSQFDAETVKRIVQDEFKRYHAPRQIIQVKGVETQTEFDAPDDVTERSFGMSAALEEMRKVGRMGIVRESEQADIDFEEEQSQFSSMPSMAQQAPFGESLMGPQRSVRLVSREEQEAEARAGGFFRISDITDPEERRQALGLPPSTIQGFTLEQIREMPRERQLIILGMEK